MFTNPKILSGDSEEVALFSVADATALEEARQIAKAFGDKTIWDVTDCFRG